MRSRRKRIGTRTLALLAVIAVQPVVAGGALRAPSVNSVDAALAATPCAGQSTGGDGLSFSAPPTIAFPSTSAGGTDQTVSAPADFKVNDQTGSHAGWRITGTSTAFSNAAGERLPADVSTVAAAGATTAAGACNTPPADGVAYPITLPAGMTPPTAGWLYSAIAGTGTGASTVNLTFNVRLPASARAGMYSSVWTLTIASGP
jgi:hypothetical protein